MDLAEIEQRYEADKDYIDFLDDNWGSYVKWLISRVKELEKLKMGYQDELAWIDKKLEQAESEIEELKEQLRFANRPGIRRAHGPTMI